MKIKYLKLLSFLILSLFITFGFVSAQNVLRYEMTTFSGPGTGASTPFFDISFLGKQYFEISTPNFKSAFQFFFDFIIGVSIATAVVIFMISAFQGIVDGGDVKNIKKGKEGMIRAITGLMIVLSTWLIINTINPDLLRLPIFNGISTGNTTNSTNVTGSGF